MEAQLFPRYKGGLSSEEVARLEELLPAALSAVRLRFPASQMEQLDELEVTLVDDATITQVHADFMDDPTATDVITFPYGEILISVDTAERQRSTYGKSLAGEVLLYLVHGLLHLAGLDDLDPGEAANMARVQEEIWAELV